MNSEKVHCRGEVAVLLLFLLLVITTVVQAEIDNPSFEVFDYNSTTDINEPNGWITENYVSVINSFECFYESEGSNDDWLIDTESPFYPYDGEKMLLVYTGMYQRNQPNFAWAYQLIDIQQGDTISGAYFFGTFDYLGFNDFGRIYIIKDLDDPEDDANMIVEISIEDVNDYSSTKGWIRFDYTFDANQVGQQYLVIKAMDYRDYVYSSYFLVDGLKICHNGIEGQINGDINSDCTVDFQDLAMLTNDWLCNCDDLQTYQDPNRNCIYGTDMDNDGIVDTNDLQLLTGNWLTGERQ